MSGDVHVQFLEGLRVKYSWSTQPYIRQAKYLDKIVESDHRFIKKITKPMMGFKAFHSEKATVAGMKLHHTMRKSQHYNAANKSIFEQFKELAA